MQGFWAAALMAAVFVVLLLATRPVTADYQDCRKVQSVSTCQYYLK